MDGGAPQDDPNLRVTDSIKNGMSLMMKYQFMSACGVFMSLYQEKDVPFDLRAKVISKLLFSTWIAYQKGSSIDNILIDLKAQLTKPEIDVLHREIAEDIPVFATFMRYLSTDFFHKVNPFSMILEKAKRMSPFVLSEAMIYVSVTRQCTFVESSLAKEIAATFFEKFKESFAQRDEKFLRQLDEKKLRVFLKDVEKITYIADQQDIELEIAFTFILSSFLSKKYDGLTRLNSLSFNRKILERIEKYNVEDRLLESMHDSLLKEWVVFQTKVWDAGNYRFEVLEKFWTLSLGQHISTIDKYFAVMPALFARIPYRMSGDRWRLVVETKEFPAAALRFIASPSMVARADETVKENVLKAMWAAMEKCENHAECMNFVGVIGTYAPNDAATRDALKRKCFEMLEKDGDSDLGIALLLRIWKSASPQSAKQDFDFLLEHCECTNIKAFFDLLVTISGCLRDFLDENEVRRLQELIQPYLTTHSSVVSGFVVAIVGVISTESLLSMLGWLSSLEYVDAAMVSLITTIFERLNNGLASVPSLRLRGIECLWHLLFTKSVRGIPAYIVTLIARCEDDESVKDFVKLCVSHIDTIGALEALDQLIQRVEEPLDVVKKNKYERPELFFDVNLTGYKACKLRVKRPLTYERFYQRVARAVGLPDNGIEIYFKGSLLPRSHVFQPDEMFNVVARSVRRTFHRDWRKLLPSSLIKPYFEKIMQLVDGNSDLSFKAFNLLNSMETDSHEKTVIESIMTSPVDFSELLDESKPFHLLYRMNTIGNCLLENNRAFETAFFTKGGFKRCFELMFTAQNIYKSDCCIQTIIEICIRLLHVSENRTDLANYQNEAISELTENIFEFMSWISAKLSKNERRLDVMCSHLLLILHRFALLKPSIISTYDGLSPLISIAIFYPSQPVRDRFAKILSILDPMDYATPLIELLDDSAKVSCDEYFNLVYKVVESYPNTLELWKAVVASLQRNLLVADKIEFDKAQDGEPYPSVDDLCGTLCSLEFVTGAFNTLHKLAFRVDLPKQTTSEFLVFVFERIVFNKQRYIPRPETLFPLVDYLLHENEDLLPTVVAKMQECSDLVLPPAPSQYALPVLTSERNQKGLNNMGATCYLNSSLQQIFRIRQIHDSLLAYKSEEGADDWCFQLQMLLAKLHYSPVQFVDESPFVRLWKGYTDEPINPHEQQDAIEFLQLVLDRLDQKLADKPVERSVTGETKQKMVGPNYESVKTGTFVDLDMVVKDVSGVTDSFRLFLEPDAFEYNDDEKGKMNVEQYHTVQKAPETLILHLKRFEFDLEYMMPRKVNSYYSFPKVLDITPLMSEGADPPGTYELTGIVMHSGSAAGGHYWSHIKNEQTEKWYTFNDTMVYPIADTFTFPDNCFGGLETRAVCDPTTNQITQQTVEKADSAYMLFYKKINREKLVREPITLMSRASLEYLLKEIEQVIIRDVMFSDGYLRFIDSLAMIDAPCLNEFLMSFFFKCMAFTFLDPKVQQVASTIRDRTGKSPGFCEFILSRSQETADYLLECPHPDMRNMCVATVSEAMTRGPRDKVNEFIQTFLDQIPACIERSPEFNDFFKPILFYVEHLDQSRGDILTKLISVIRECQARQVVSSIAAVLQAVLILIKSQNKQDEYRSLLLTPTFFAAFSRNEGSAFDFACLLIAFQDTRAVLTEYQQNMWGAQSRATSYKILASHFAATLAMEDSLTADRLSWFNSIFRTKNWSSSQIADFLLEAAAKLRSHKAVGSSLFLGSANLKAWMINPDPMLRNGVAELVLAMFPSYPRLSIAGSRMVVKGDTPGSRTEQDNLLKLIDSLFAMTPALIKACTTAASSQNADLQIPTANYYDLLGWALSYAKEAPEILLKQRSTIVKSLVHLCSLKGSRLPVYNLLDFIGFSFTKQLTLKILDAETAREVLNALSNVPSDGADIYVEKVFTSIGHVLSYMSSANNDTLVNSGVFEAALASRLYSTSTLMQSLIDKVLTAENSVVVAKTLFKKSLIMTNSTNYCHFYFDLVKRLVALNNANVEQFSKTECYAEIVAAVNQIFRKRLSLSDYAPVTLLVDILQLFCSKFVTENKGKTVYFFFDKMGTFVSFWSSNAAFLKNLTEWIQMSSVPKQFVSLAIELLECVLACDESLAPVFTASVYRGLPKDFYVRLHSDLRPKWASMVAKLCAKYAAASGEDVLAIALLDLSALGPVLTFQVFKPYFDFVRFACDSKLVTDRAYVVKLAAVLSGIIEVAGDIAFFRGDVAKLLVRLELRSPSAERHQRWIASCLKAVAATIHTIQPDSLSDQDAKILTDSLRAAQLFIETAKAGTQIEPSGLVKGEIEQIVPKIREESPAKAALAKILLYFINF